MVTGASTEQLHALIMATNNNGRAVWQRLQRPEASAALTVGYSGISLDQMDWSSQAHALRTMNPMIWLTVEANQLEIDPVRGDYEVRVSRDQFTDYIQEQKDLVTGQFTGAMLDNNFMGRIRRRMDGADGETTRLLFQSKIDATVDEFGIKSAEKQDEREDGRPVSAARVQAAEENFQEGNGITGSPGAIATRELALGMKERGLLPKVENHGETLQMETVANKRAPRGRYHLNETSPEALRDHFRACGEGKLQELISLLQTSPMPAADRDALLQEANALLDRSAIVAEAAAGLKALDPNVTVDLALVNNLWPDQAATRDKLESKERKVVADAIFKLYGAFAERIDDAQRAIGGSTDREVRRAGGVDELRDFFRAQQNNAFGADALKMVSTAGPFLQAFDAQLAGPDKPAFVDALATHLAAGNNTRLRDAPNAAAKDAVLADIRKNLVTAHAEILHRMVEEGGAAAIGLWNDSRRLAYAGASRSGWSNFIIDSFDLTEGYTPEQFKTLTNAQLASRAPLDDPSKMLTLMVSNDFQIELGYEKPYLQAILTAKHALLAPLFLDFAQQKAGSRVDLNNRTTFTDYLKTVASIPSRDDAPSVKAARDAFVKELQEYVGQRVPELKIQLEDIITLYRDADGNGVSSFSAELVEFSKMTPETVADRTEDLVITSEIWRDTIQAQMRFADYRGQRVLEILNGIARSLGMTVTLSWGAPTMSKDQIVSALAQGRQV